MLDILTLSMILLVVAVIVACILWLAALPGTIARERGHPQADAISVCGWLSLVTMFASWPIALVWAYARPANVAVNSDKRP